MNPPPEIKAAGSPQMRFDQQPRKVPAMNLHRVWQWVAAKVLPGCCITSRLPPEHSEHEAAHKRTR